MVEKPRIFAVSQKNKKNQKKFKKGVDICKIVLYNMSCVEGNTNTQNKKRISGCGSAWLERLVWDQEVAGSNPVTPIVRV